MAGVITNDGFLECIILYNALCTMHPGETMHYKPCPKHGHTGELNHVYQEIENYNKKQPNLHIYIFQ